MASEVEDEDVAEDFGFSKGLTSGFLLLVDATSEARKRLLTNVPVPGLPSWTSCLSSANCLSMYSRKFSIAQPTRFQDLGIKDSEKTLAGTTRTMTTCSRIMANESRYVMDFASSNSVSEMLL